MSNHADNLPRDSSDLKRRLGFTKTMQKRAAAKYAAQDRAFAEKIADIEAAIAELEAEGKR